VSILVNETLDDRQTHIDTSEEFIIPAKFWNNKEPYYKRSLIYKFSYIGMFRGFSPMIYSEPNQTNTNINIYINNNINTHIVSLSEFNDITMFLGS
jgi:hypothetical protein